ncbi:MAG: primosomal protein N' [Deltaproteobacteria bacterium HGW-Deltaproteobacteria-13]|jgi:primosomal protein N' (replication factor Y)|nr:MAG: primosomal protein N' [Deltaproteobacteria bacterium HGW-Deltaproteobacteria-13]
MFVDVALNIPSDNIFTYEVPENLEREIEIGKRVFVPFGNRKRTGFIAGIIPSCDLKNIKPIFEILDDEPLFGSSDLEFYQWIANYFMYPLGKALAELIPSGSEKKDFFWITPQAAEMDTHLPPAQQKLLTFLQQYPQGIAVNNITKVSGLKNISSALRKLHLAELVKIEKKQNKQLSPLNEKIVRLEESKIAGAKLTDKQKKLIEFIQAKGRMSFNDLTEESGISSAVVNKLHEKGIIKFTTGEKMRTASFDSAIRQNKNPIILNNQQNRAMEEISGYLKKNAFTPILLHGVTGSGKTEIYLKAIEEVLANGGSAIYLVPEIALTPQLISRVAGRFDERQMAVLHSGIAESVRYDQWRQIKRGLINLVIGTRSALFAPLSNLKLIIVDEEHDASYKQDERLCYNARDLAVLKAKMASAVVITGSATPSVRTYFNARTKKYRYLELSKRVDDRPMPVVEIIDMKAQQEESGKVPILSGALISGIQKTLDKKEQVLLFLNKRGFDTFLVCADCGYNFRCPNCAVSLKNHAAEGVVKCHYCDYTIKSLPLCPSCKSNRILSYGTGTQKLEKEIEKLFPDARIQRMDSDTTSKKGAQEKILRALDERKIDILIGTQMITKGHDFPFITLVGVISADTSLNMPDFRAGEKTFQLITQVAGRGGRGDAPGRVIIQTFNPEHYALRHAQNHDYQSFYAEEVDFRQSLQYPPFGRIINLRLSSIKKDALVEEAHRLGKTAKKLSARHGNIAEILGPAESPLAKIRGRFRWQMLIKGTDINALHQIAREIIGANKNSQVKITADVDPESFM